MKCDNETRVISSWKNNADNKKLAVCEKFENSSLREALGGRETVCTSPHPNAAIRFRSSNNSDIFFKISATDWIRTTNSTDFKIESLFFTALSWAVADAQLCFLQCSKVGGTMWASDSPHSSYNRCKVVVLSDLFSKAFDKVVCFGWNQVISLGRDFSRSLGWNLVDARNRLLPLRSCLFAYSLQKFQSHCQIKITHKNCRKDGKYHLSDNTRSNSARRNVY